MGADRAQPSATLETPSSESASPVRSPDTTLTPGLSNRTFSEEMEPSAGAQEEPSEPCAECAQEDEEDGDEKDEKQSSWLTNQNRASFLADLRSAVCASADEGMAGTGNTSQGCPYIDYWFSKCEARTTAQLRQGIRRFAPETEGVTQRAQIIQLVAARVRRSVDTWATTGEIGGLPKGVPARLPGAGILGGVFFRGRTGAALPQPNPAVVRASLGPGRPLSATVRKRMEPAFGVSFSGVRLHDDPVGASVADRLQAQALAVGEHVAFADGKYRPGTPAGDALLAHELAHVVQQGAGANSTHDGATSAFEADADRSARTVVGRLWSANGQSAGRGFPKLSSGLSLHRCGASQPEVKSGDTASTGACPTLPVVAPPSGGGSNAIDARGAGIIAIAQDKARPLAQRGIQVVRAIICQYYPDELSKVKDVVFEQPNAAAPDGKFDGIYTTSVGSGGSTMGILDVSRTVVEAVPTHLAHEVLRVRHELDHINQYRSGMAGGNKKHEREFLAHFAEATNPELPGTGRISAPTRIRIIDASLKHYYCLSADKQTEYADRRKTLLERRGQEQGRVKDKAKFPATDPPTTCPTEGIGDE